MKNSEPHSGLQYNLATPPESSDISLYLQVTVVEFLPMSTFLVISVGQDKTGGLFT